MFASSTVHPCRWLATGGLRWALISILSRSCEICGAVYSYFYHQDGRNTTIKLLQRFSRPVCCLIPLLCTAAGPEFKHYPHIILFSQHYGLNCAASRSLGLAFPFPSISPPQSCRIFSVPPEEARNCRHVAIHRGCKDEFRDTRTICLRSLTFGRC